MPADHRVADVKRQANIMWADFSAADKSRYIRAYKLTLEAKTTGSSKASVAARDDMLVSKPSTAKPVPKSSEAKMKSTYEQADECSIQRQARL